MSVSPFVSVVSIDGVIIIISLTTDELECEKSCLSDNLTLHNASKWENMMTRTHFHDVTC